MKIRDARTRGAAQPTHAAGRDLAAALTADDAAEDAGMNPDDRQTCHPCKSWADHAHDAWSGARITLDEYQERRKTGGY